MLNPTSCILISNVKDNSTASPGRIACVRLVGLRGEKAPLAQ